MNKVKEHIKILDFLRGIAALGVVLFHFSHTALPTISQNYLSEVLYYGKYGVQIFFVISGFVIPYSMFKSNYKITSFFKNIAKRFVRISPPAYVAILLTIGLYFSSIILLHRPIEGMDWPGLNFASIIGNLTYTVPYLSTNWFNPVFWTLAVEFQFYIIIGAILPLLLTKNFIKTSTVLLGVLALGFIDFEWFFRHGSFFIMGILLFLNKESLIKTEQFYIVSTLAIIACFFQYHLPGFIFGVSTFIIIHSGINLNFKFTNFLGSISYSLYITHLTVGTVAEVALKRVINIHEYPMGKIVMLFIYAGITILFAKYFYKYIEQPFIKLSKKIKY